MGNMDWGCKHICYNWKQNIGWIPGVDASELGNGHTTRDYPIVCIDCHLDMCSGDMGENQM